VSGARADGMLDDEEVVDGAAGAGEGTPGNREPPAGIAEVGIAVGTAPPAGTSGVIAGEDDAGTGSADGPSRGFIVSPDRIGFDGESSDVFAGVELVAFGFIGFVIFNIIFIILYECCFPTTTTYIMMIYFFYDRRNSMLGSL